MAQKEIIKIFTNEAVKAIRTAIRKVDKTISVRQEGTWIDLSNRSQEFGYLTESNTLALIELGFIDKSFYGSKQWLISPKNQHFILNLLGYEVTYN
jgi:hypothetical protein